MPEISLYDIIIIGAGPAGSSLARLVAAACPGLRVLLLEKRRLAPLARSAFSNPQQPSEAAARPPDKNNEKCCGGLLAPDAAKALHQMGLALPPQLLSRLQPLQVRALDLKTGLVRAYARPYGNLKRREFEEWLLALLPPQVEFQPGSRCLSLEYQSSPASGPLKDEPGFWQLQVSQNGLQRLFRCRLLVSAEGAASLLRRKLENAAEKAARLRSSYLAVQDSFAEEWQSNEHSAFFHPGLTDFYGWVIPKQGETLLGLALPLAAQRRGGKTPGQIMEEARALLAGQGYHFKDKKPQRQACLLLRPGPGEIFHGRQGAFCIGEAAGWISPSSAEGFSYAFHSARALAKAIAKEYQRSGQGNICGDICPERILARYRRTAWPLRLNIAWKSCKARIMYSPRLRRLIMKSGLGAK